MDDGFTRREMIGASALALTLTGTGAGATAPAQAGPQPRPRERLERWKFHLGHAADVGQDFGCVGRTPGPVDISVSGPGLASPLLRIAAL